MDTATADPGASTELALTGMTCAACAARIERSLNKLDGVEASVNYATETASVHFDPLRLGPEALIATVERMGYGATEVATGAPVEPEPHTRTARLVTALVLGLPVMAMAMASPLQFRGWQWVTLVLTAPIVTWVAWPFHRVALRLARHGDASMDTLVSLGVMAASLWSLWAMVVGDAGRLGMTMPFSIALSSEQASHHVYFEVAAALVAFVTLGRWLEARAKRSAGEALAALGALGVQQVCVLDEADREHTVDIESLRVGDRFMTRPGEQVATDGIVESGHSAIDLSLLTGEPMPVDVGPGDRVVGAALNVSGRVVVRATAVGAGTTLARITRLVREAQSGKAPIQRLADRVSAVFVPAVLMVAALTAGFWTTNSSDRSLAAAAAVAVLVVACPCALGLATPTALLVGVGRAAQLGVLIRGPQVLESTRAVDTVVLDKTGTITTGRMQVTRVVAVDADRAEVARLAAAVERGSLHPLAVAIAALDTSAQATAVTEQPGIGVRGTVGDRVVHIGRISVLAAGLVGPDLAAEIVASEAGGDTAVAVVEERSEGPCLLGVICVGDRIKDGGAEAVAALHALGLRVVMLTGDNAGAAQAVGRAVGADEVIAEVLPADKVATVRSLQDHGAVVAMVGDGVNDAAALAQADLGMAMGSGTDVAIAAADLTILRNDLSAVGDAIALSRRTLATIKANLFWAFAYNTAAVPIAAAGLLNPMLAGMAMAASSLVVVGNSLRLRHWSP